MHAFKKMFDLAVSGHYIRIGLDLTVVGFVPDANLTRTTGK